MICTKHARTLTSSRIRGCNAPVVVSLGALGVLFSTTLGMAEEGSWKEGFAGCTGTSPYIEALISTADPDVRPLMRIGEMQAWAIRGEDGAPVTALTTEDGLTIVGTIIGPQGEDISAALLATQPSPGAAGIITPAVRDALTEDATSKAPAVSLPTAAMPRSNAAMTPIPDAGAAVTAPGSAISPALARLRDAGQAATGATPETAPTRLSLPEGAPATAPITASEQPSAEVQAGIDTIFAQAGAERIWFSAGTPKEGAPVVYMLADPECPHCQWTIDQMHGQIAGGEIDLRIIFAPITGVGGFNTALSILHSENIPETFMAHMTATTRGTEAVTQMDLNEADRSVVQGIVDNINWMRANKMPGVPFFLYQTDQGARFAFSELPADILTVAKAQ